MQDKNKDYYKILGIEKGANEKKIKSAFRVLARKFHPDVNKHPAAAQTFKEIYEAYEVLSDPNKRWNYDNRDSNNFYNASPEDEYTQEEEEEEDFITVHKFWAYSEFVSANSNFYKKMSFYPKKSFWEEISARIRFFDQGYLKETFFLDVFLWVLIVHACLFAIYTLLK